MRRIDREMLDGVSGEARRSPRLRKNLNFHAANDSPCHRLLNALEPGTYIRPHRHLGPDKDESILVVRGRLGCVVFDDDGRVRESVLLEPAGEVVGVDIPRGELHTLVALESGTVFFESKGGPWAPLAPGEAPDWGPEEGSPEAPGYLARLEARFR